MARSTCPICGAAGALPLPRGIEGVDQTWPQRVDGFGAMWDAFDDWLCVGCGFRWPHAASGSPLNSRVEDDTSSARRTSRAGVPVSTPSEEVMIG